MRMPRAAARGLAAAAALLPVAGLAALTPSVGAAPPPLGGVAWPRGVVPYHDATPVAIRPFVREGIRQWNASGLRIRFVAVPRSRARVILSGRAVVHPGQGGGEANVGPQPRTGFARFRIPPSDPGYSVSLVVHELGHTLGLDHPRDVGRTCTVMGAGVFRPENCPTPPAPDLQLCSFVLPADVRVLARRYGLRPTAAAFRPRFCPKGTRPPDPVLPEGLRATLDPGLPGVVQVVVEWDRWTPAAGQTDTVTAHPVACAQRDTAPHGGFAVRRADSIRFVWPGVTLAGGLCIRFESRTSNSRGVDGSRFGVEALVAHVEVAVPAAGPIP